MGGQVIKYHHTVETYIGALLRAGFELEALKADARRPRRTDRMDMKCLSFTGRADSGKGPSIASEGGDGRNVAHVVLLSMQQ